MKISDLKNPKIISGGIQNTKPNTAPLMNPGNIPPTPPAPGWSPGGFAQNVVSSGASLLGGVGNAILHPIDTVTNLGSTALGGVEKLAGQNTENTQKFDALGQFFQDRYGISDILEGKIGSGVNKIANTMYNDPVGFLADLSSVIGGAGAVAGGVGKVANIGKAGEIGSALAKVSDYLNPLSLRTKTQALRDVGVLKPLETQGGVIPTRVAKMAGGIEESNLRLTQRERGVFLENPKIKAQIQRAASKVPPGGIQEQYAHANDIVQGMDEIRQAAFKTYDAYGETPFSRDAVIAKMQSWADSNYGKSPVTSQRLAQVESYLKNFKSSMPENIGWGDMEAFKSGLWKEAKFSDAGYVTKEVAGDLGHQFKQLIDTSAEKRGLQIGNEKYATFNRDYGDILTYQTYLEHALGRPEVGSISSRLIGGALGATLGGSMSAVGAAIAPTIARELPISAIKSYVAKGLRKLPQTKNPTVSIPARVGLGARTGDIVNQQSTTPYGP